jgi:hypothetical protein
MKKKIVTLPVLLRYEFVPSEDIDLAMEKIFCWNIHSEK